jgi:hypothetical protein
VQTGHLTTEYGARRPHATRVACVARRSPRHCLRSSNAEQPVLTRRAAGSSPAGGTNADEAARRGASLPTKIRRVRNPSSAPANVLAARRSCSGFVNRRRRFDSDRGLVGNPVHDTTPSSNGSGSEITNLRMVVRIHPESRIGRDLGSDWSPNPISGVRILDGLQARQAAHLVVRSVSYAERAGFDPLACYDDDEVWLNLVRARGSGPRDWWFESTHLDKPWRAAHLGVMAVLQTAGAGFDSLARYERVPSPSRDTYGVRGVVAAREIVTLAGTGSIPFAHPRRGGMFHGGELHLQCGCGRFDSGPLHDQALSNGRTPAFDSGDRGSSPRA